MVCVRPARSRTFADQWQCEVRILEPRDQPTSSNFRICYFLDLVEGFACKVVINSECGSSCSGIADWSNISQNGSQSEGAISKHEP